MRVMTIGQRSDAAILDKIAECVRGGVCERQEYANFLVANVAAQTSTQSPVLINVCISGDERKSVELRVRARHDEVVKGVGELLTATFRE